MVKSDAAKEACVAEDERATRLLQDEVIVLFGAEARGLGPHFPAHAEMKADPITAGKFEEHLLPAGVRTEKALSR
jgi:hypothetical protein